MRKLFTFKSGDLPELVDGVNWFLEQKDKYASCLDVQIYQEHNAPYRWYAVVECLTKDVGVVEVKR